MFAHVDIPDAGVVVKRGVDLADLFNVAPVPYIQTVIIIDTCQLMERNSMHIKC